MLKGSRVAKALDTQLLAEALSMPGIDPRTWVSLAVVTNVVVDPLEGVFADVVLMPSRMQECARVGQEYAGNGFGLHTPIEVDDEVLVAAPSGDPDEGLVITRRLFSASDPPPQAAVDHPSDVVLVVKADRNVRLIVSGDGKVVLATDDAAQDSMRGTKFMEELTRLLDVVKAFGLAANGLVPNGVGAAVDAFKLIASQYVTDKVVIP